MLTGPSPALRRSRPRSSGGGSVVQFSCGTREVALRDRLGQPFLGGDGLRKNLPKVLDSLHDAAHQVVITCQGKPAAVLVDVETYLEVPEALRELSDPAYLAARQEIRRGEGVDAEEVFRRKGL